MRNMTQSHSTKPSAAEDLFATQAEALADEALEADSAAYGRLYDGDQLEREERAALRRVAGLSTELEDITEVEYRQLRLERVVLASVWSEGTAEDAENSLRELASSPRAPTRSSATASSRRASAGPSRTSSRSRSSTGRP